MTRVLIIDDSRTIQRSVTAQVEAAGGQVAGTASDGDEGVRLYQTLMPDLVLLDITMPNKDGREALKEILEINARATVVMLSAISSDEVIKECLALGAKAFLNKTTGFADGSLKDELARYLKPKAA